MKKQFEEEEQEVTEVRQANKRGKGNRKKSKGRRDTERRGRKEGFHNTDNDVSWYASNAEILRASASFSYFTPLGTKFPWSKYNSAENHVSSDTLDVPGIMALTYISAPGIANTFSDPVNVAADNLYSFIRYQNSGAKNYDAPDLMLYLLAMDEIYSWWAKGVRAYGTIRLYSQTNRYLPKALLYAQGFDAESCIGNEAKFRGIINALAAQISAFCVPGTLPYFARHFWLNTNIYTDNDVFKPQLYLFKQAVYRTYEEKTSTAGGYLETHPVPKFDSTEGMTIDQWAEILNTMLNKVIKSEDIGIMSGDILKAFGRENLYTLQAIDENYTVLPVYNEEVLSQIENYEASIAFSTAEVEADVPWYRTCDIKQDVDTNNIVFAPKVASDQPVAHPHLINFHKNEITPADSMIATRMKTSFKWAGKVTPTGNIPIWEVVSCGSEIPLCMQVYYQRNDTDTGFEHYNISGSLNESTSQAILLRDLAGLANFDWSPVLLSFTKTGSGVSSQYVIHHINQDMANYTVIGFDELDQTNVCAILSMFKIPVLGSF